MAYSKITKVILYVVAGISLLVVLFFYVSPNTVDIDELEMRVEELANPVVESDMAAPAPVADSIAADSASVVSDSASVAAAAEEAKAQEMIAAANVVSVSEIRLRDHMSGWEYLVFFRTDIALAWAYILLIMAALAALLFPMISILSNPKGLIRLALVLVGAAVIIVVSYLLASGNPINIIGYTGTGNSNPATLKMVDTTLFLTYILFGMALLSILYSIISRVFK